MSDGDVNFTDGVAQGILTFSRDYAGLTPLAEWYLDLRKNGLSRDEANAEINRTRRQLWHDGGRWENAWCRYR